MSADVLALRRRLVEHLIERGVLRTLRIRRAFEAVGRERFLPGRTPAEVYEDQSIVIKRRGDVAISSSSQPSMMALMLEQLAVESGERVLEIGAGSGYNAALLAELVGPNGSVTSVDIDPALARDARRRLGRRSNVRVLCADAETVGFDEPFDRIIVTAAASEVAPRWFEALRDGGRIVVPLELGTLQSSVAFDRCGASLVSRSCIGALFMPLRGAAAHVGNAIRLGDVPLLTLRTVDSAPVDADVLWRLLCGGGRREPERFPLDADALDDLGNWLDLRERAFCALSASGLAAARRVIPNLIPEPHAAAFLMTYGVRSAAGLALLEPCADGVALRAYGELAARDRLLAGLRGWFEAGRPRAREVRVEVVYGARPAPAGALVLPRAHCCLVVGP